MKGLSDAHHFPTFLFQLLNQGEYLVLNRRITKVFQDRLSQCFTDMNIVLAELLFCFPVETRSECIGDLMLDFQWLILLHPVLKGASLIRSLINFLCKVYEGFLHFTVLLLEELNVYLFGIKADYSLLHKIEACILFSHSILKLGYLKPYLSDSWQLLLKVLFDMCQLIDEFLVLIIELILVCIELLFDFFFIGDPL